MSGRCRGVENETADRENNGRGHFAIVAVVLGVSAPSSAGTRTASVALTGAGSTFDAPFFNVAFAKYHQLHRGVSIGYSAVGSGAGIKRFSGEQVNFGATDVPMTSAEQAAALGGSRYRCPLTSGLKWSSSTCAHRRRSDCI